MKTILKLLCSTILLAIALRAAAAPGLGQGQMAGEPAETSIILQARLTEGAKLVNGDLPGCSGWGRFEIADNPDFRDSRFTDWSQAGPGRDFIIKARVDGLKPGTRYHYRTVYGADQASAKPAPACTFRTLGGAASAEPVSIAVVTGMNYAFFHEGKNPERESGGKKKTEVKVEKSESRKDRKGKERKAKAKQDTGKAADGGTKAGGYSGPDKALGYPGLAVMAKVKPDYFVGTGDNVYYDHPAATAAQTPEAMRRKWHEQFVQPRYIELFATLATWWEKDDHDWRYNDADLTGNKEPSPELGLRIFNEQLPLVVPADARFTPYRTFRVNKDLQIWLSEGREFRSPNADPDGPDKTLWGAGQRDWLKRTIKASDAPFKVLISPTCIVGPDTASKRDNHANLRGFHVEGQAFIKWVKDEGLTKNFFVVCGDRHWQYHAIDPTGLEEFSCGSLVFENAIVGTFPGDKKSNDPEGKIRQPYHPKEPVGGFLLISARPGSATFAYYDDAGAKRYEVEKKAQ